MTYLHTVTITGADDGVAADDLAKLSQRFPFVEWGLLWNLKPPKPRYPSFEWLQGAWWLPRRSLHLCGHAAREAFAGNFAPGQVAARVVGSQRVQLNGFSCVEDTSQLLPFLSALEGVECIVQCSSLVALDKANLLAQTGHNVSALLDPSGGTGRPLGEVPPLPDVLRVGFAGGINPDNVVATIERLETLQRPYWIDLETGVRDENDRFDLGRAEAVLAAAEQFFPGAKP